MFQFEEKEIATLQRLGFKRWTKGPHDRLYVSAATLGLVCEYYHTGNIRSATFNGVVVSNSEARRMETAKTFADLRTGLVVSDNQRLFDAAVTLIADVIAGKYDEEEDDDEHYIPSASAGDYSPNCPWKAPGMRISDFIRL